MFKTRIGSFCLLPFDRFTIHSKKSLSEVKEALAKEIKWVPKGELGFKNHDQSKILYGEINNLDFILRRTINYKNSFLPTIIGHIKPSTYNVSGTDLDIKMRLGIFVMIFGLVWFGFLGAFSINLLSNISKDHSTIVMDIGMLVFGYLLFTLPFNYEVAKARKLLIDITQGELI